MHTHSPFDDMQAVRPQQHRGRAKLPALQLISATNSCHFHEHRYNKCINRATKVIGKRNCFILYSLASLHNRTGSLSVPHYTMINLAQQAPKDVLAKMNSLIYDLGEVIKPSRSSSPLKKMVF